MYACAGGVASGSMLGLTLLGRELTQHATQSWAGSVSMALPAAVGVVMGLLYPRRVIQRHLAEAGAGGGGTAGRVDHAVLARPAIAFATTLTAVLLCVLAVLWLIAWIVADSLEPIGGLLRDAFLLPAGIGQVLLLSPVAVVTWLVSLGGTVSIVALHGWYRELTDPQTRLARLWLVLLTAGCAGAVLCGTIGSSAAGAVVMLALLMSAAGLPLLARGQQVDPGVRRAAVSAGRSPDRAALTTVATAAVLVACSLAIVRPEVPFSSRAATLALAAAGGLTLGRAMLALRCSTSCGVLALLAAAVAMLLPYDAILHPSIAVDLVRVGFVGASSAAGVTLIARRIGRATRNVQRALALLGALTALALGVGLTAAGVAVDVAGPRFVLVGSALLGAAVAGGLLWRDWPARREVRYGGLAGLGLAGLLLALQASWSGGRAVEPTVAPLRIERIDSVCELLSAGGLRVGRVSESDRAGALTQRSIAWSGRRYDVIVIERGAWESALAGRELERLMRRCRAALVRGGRCLAELGNEPSDAGVAGSESALTQWLARIFGGAQEARLETAEGAVRLLAAGPDLFEWLIGRRMAAGYRVSLRPLP